jgi:hypothetical protein
MAQIFYASRLPASWQARLSKAAFYYGFVTGEPTNATLLTSKLDGTLASCAAFRLGIQPPQALLLTYA